MIPALEAYVGVVPDTQAALAFRIGYELTNTRKLVDRALYELVLPRYNSNHCLVSILQTLQALDGAYDVRDHLEDLGFPDRSSDYVDVCAVFPGLNAVRAERLRADLCLEGTSFRSWHAIPITGIFYSETLVHAHLKDTKVAHPPREHPLPNTLPYPDMLHLHTTLVRYEQCLSDIERLANTEEFGDPFQQRKPIQTAVRKLRRRLQRAFQETRKVSLIAEFQALGMPAGHSADTLFGDFTAEQLQDMVDGHPKKVFKSTSVQHL